MMGLNKGVALRHVRKSFLLPSGSSLEVLGGVSLELPAACTTAIVGPSGCGKTTLLRVIAGLEEVDSGDVILGDEIRQQSVPIVWQDHRLFGWLSLARNVAFPLEVHGMGRAAALQRASVLLEKVGLAQFSAYLPAQVSGGMSARATIARALASEPACLLLDEPFTSVDYHLRQDLFSLVRDIQRDGGLTIAFVTHDLRDAIELSDFVAVMSARPGTVRGLFRVDGGRNLEPKILELLRASEGAAEPNS